MVNRLFPPVLSRRRIVLAFMVAIMTDALQFLFGALTGPIGMMTVDELLDIVAMLAQTWILGFHPLFLPTFIIKAIPEVDLAPGWTVCTALVVAMRRGKRAPANPAAPPPVPPMLPATAKAPPVPHDVIDV